MSRLEHANITVADPDAAAALFERLFGWQVRWAGSAINGGHSVHVGARDSYLAFYRPSGVLSEAGESYTTVGGLNHVGLVVDDLDVMQARIEAAGFVTHSHADYEPGRRFYADLLPGLEVEVIAYDPPD